MNAELAMASLEDAKAHPEEFDMETFLDGEHSNAKGFVKDSAEMTVPPCGTTACFAGFASLRAAPVGSRIARKYRLDPVVVHPDEKLDRAPHVEKYATEALGITIEQANVLFYLADIDEVEAVVKHLASHPDASGEDCFIVARRA